MKQALPIILIAMMLIAFVGSFAFFSAVSNNDVRPDENLCRTDETMPQHDVVLVDATNKLPIKDIKETKNLINDVSEKIPTDGRLTVISFVGNGDSEDEYSFFKPLFSRCNPGNASEANAIFESKKRKKATWRSKFKRVLDDYLNKLENLEEGDTTPLLESLEVISSDRNFKSNIPVRKIHIISDLLQNYNGVSSYRGHLNFETFSETTYFKELNIDLTGVDIIILQIERLDQKHLQGEKQRERWQKLFEAWDAKSIEFYKPSLLTSP